MSSRLHGTWARPGRPITPDGRAGSSADGARMAQVLLRQLTAKNRESSVILQQSREPNRLAQRVCQVPCASW